MKLRAQVSDWPCKNNAFAGSEWGDSGGFSANQSKPWRHGEHSYYKLSIQVCPHFMMTSRQSKQLASVHDCWYDIPYYLQIALPNFLFDVSNV